MPAAASTIRTVPGGNDGAAGNDGEAGSGDGSAAGGRLPPRLTRSPTTTAPMTTSASSGTTHGLRRRGPTGSGPGSDVRSSGDLGGASTGDHWTSTPGPAGVVTSDQPEPSHHRTNPGEPSGSGYHPGAGAGWLGPVTGSQ
jgi:hypothetical protein